MFENEILTAALTILAGIIVFIFGQIFVEFILKPIVDLRQEMGKISSSLVYYADIYTNPGVDGLKDRQLEANRELRKRAAELLAKKNVIYHRLLGKITPSEKNILDAATKLIFLSNALYMGDSSKNENVRREIETLLDIPLID